ncbi:MAG: hypothetical protein Q8O93_05290 [bacterium]|nr:hypothetical protein [bacterium]
MLTTNYKGSETTKNMVSAQIVERWGEEEAKNYDALHNCATYKAWLSAGYRVKKGEKALRSVTYVEILGDNNEVIKKYPKAVCLFYEKQVEQITA